MFKFIKKLFSNELENKIISYLRYNIYNDYNSEPSDIPFPRSYELHYIKVKKRFNKINIYMYIGRPGIFIGARGTKYNLFKEKLSKRFKNINIIIKEYDPLDSLNVRKI